MLVVPGVVIYGYNANTWELEIGIEVSWPVILVGYFVKTENIIKTKNYQCCWCRRKDEGGSGEKRSKIKEEGGGERGREMGKQFWTEYVKIQIWEWDILTMEGWISLPQQSGTSCDH